MNQSNNKFYKYLEQTLFSLKGKLTKSQFKKIVKYYGWKMNYKKIHIVGTNGKGSNAKFLCDELIENNYSVGLFTSPHLINLFERIKINNVDIDLETFTFFLADLKYRFKEINFGFFDVLFLAALKIFEDRNIDVAIFEGGIGAKKDIVNFINSDIVLITSISLDHENLLGKSKSLIAIDKSHAIKKENHVYISNAIDNNIVKIFQQQAKIKNNEFIFIVDVNKNNFYEINKSLSQFVLKNEFNIPKFKSSFIMPLGRMQMIKINDVTCYVDVSHNEEGILKTLEFFEQKNIHFEQIVVSLSSDKNQKEILKLIHKRYNNVNIFAFQNNGRKPLQINEYVKDYIKIYDLRMWLNKLKSETLFIGSFYFVSQILQEVGDWSKYK